MEIRDGLLYKIYKSQKRNDVVTTLRNWPIPKSVQLGLLDRTLAASDDEAENIHAVARKLALVQLELNVLGLGTL